MKKIFIFIIILVLQLPLFVNAKSNNQIISNEKIISTSTKYYKTIESLDNIHMNGNFNYNLLTKTVEVTEEEYNNSENLININSSSTSQTTYKKITISIVESGSKYKYIATLEWKNMPAVRSYDILAIGFYKSVKASNISYETYYCLENKSCTRDQQHSEVKNTSGIGAIFQIPTSNDLISLKSTLTLTIDKNVNTVIKKQSAIADYSHATKSISESNAKKISINLANGIMLDNSIFSYYDAITGATTTLNCNW